MGFPIVVILSECIFLSLFLALSLPFFFYLGIPRSIPTIIQQMDFQMDKPERNQTQKFPLNNYYTHIHYSDNMILTEKSHIQNINTE